MFLIFIGAIIGALFGSLPGAIIGGLIIGVGEKLFEYSIGPMIGGATVTQSYADEIGADVGGSSVRRALQDGFDIEVREGGEVHVSIRGVKPSLCKKYKRSCC